MRSTIRNFIIKSSMLKPSPFPLSVRGMFASVAFVLTIAAAQGASASDGGRFANGYDGAQAGVVPATYRNRSSRSYRYGRHGQRRFSQRLTPRYSRNNFNRNFYNYSAPLSNYARGCQRVSKQGFWNGRRASIGGRQCIDARGYSYIVPNSRYLIRYW